VQAVLLDAAGTLIRTARPVAETYAAVARAHGAVLDPDRLAKAFAQVFADMPGLAFDWSSTAELHALERDWWRSLVSRVISTAGDGVTDFDTFFEALYSHYAQGAAWACFPEVPGVLDELRARGCRLAVVSNFDSRLPGILEDLDIRSRFDAVIHSSAARHAKPDPAIFALALDALAVTPANAVHVGDGEVADLQGAASAGLKALLLRRERPQASNRPDVISSLDELPGLLLATAALTGR
jgi:putative hydrolase of the HAD superfamily